MDASRRAQLLESLRDRSAALVDDWYRAIGQTAYVPFAATVIRQHLADLAQQAIVLLVTEPFDHEEAEAIGKGLAGLHYLDPTVLGRTLELFMHHLCTELPPDQVAAVHSNLAGLLGAMAAGFWRQALRTVLAEQEGVRGALIGRLRESEASLRDAHRELERRVVQRTAELARTNKELRREIAERRRAEAALEESEQTFRILSELTSDFAYAVRVEPDGLLVAEWVTEAHARITGYTPQEAIEAGDWRRMIYPEDMPLAEGQLVRVLAGHTGVAEYRIVTKQGELRWVCNHAYPVWDEGQGRIVRIYAAAQDITAQKQAEEALRESEERWRSLVENSPDIVVTLDREGRILFMNRPIRARTVEEVLGANIMDYVEPQHRDLVKKTMQQAFERGAPGQFEVRAGRRLGGTAWYAARLVPLPREGPVKAVMVTARDITERKQIEEMKDNLIRDVSHELRTPLAKMQMSLELLMELMEKDQIDRERVTRIGGLAFGNAQQLLHTVEGILDLSALEAGAAVYQMGPVRFRELIRDVILDMQPLAVAKGLELAADLAHRLPVVNGDPQKLFRVLSNLIENAIKFSDRGRVTVSARAVGQEIEIGVSDSGVGVMPLNLERIFERFFQEQYNSSGVGVGLAICRTIVEAHGGRIWAESAGRGQGATVRFRLPLEQG